MALKFFTSNEDEIQRLVPECTKIHISSFRDQILKRMVEKVLKRLQAADFY